MQGIGEGQSFKLVIIKVWLWTSGITWGLVRNVGFWFLPQNYRARNPELQLVSVLTRSPDDADAQ